MVGKEPRVYTQEERNAAAIKIVQGSPSLWSSAKRGVFIAIAVSALGLGYKQNVVEGYLNSEKAQQEIAQVLHAERDQRSAVERLFNLGTKPAEIKVGEQFFTKRDSNGRITSIGRDRILKGIADYTSMRPTLPITKQAIPVGAAAVVLGAGLGTIAGYNRRKNRIQLSEDIRAGKVSPSRFGRWRANTKKFNQKIKTKFNTGKR